MLLAWVLQCSITLRNFKQRERFFMLVDLFFELKAVTWLVLKKRCTLQVLTRAYGRNKRIHWPPKEGG